MNLSEEEIDVVDDETLRRAKLTKIRTETAVLLISVLVYVPILLSDDVKYRVRRQFKKWRREFFGPAPLTEEQIQLAERQVIIEAMRTVRYGE